MAQPFLLLLSILLFFPSCAQDSSPPSEVIRNSPSQMKDPKLYDILVRFLEETPIFTLEDWGRVQKLKHPEKNSLEEALMALSLFYMVGDERFGSFEKDLADLEKEYQLDLARTVEENRFLHHNRTLLVAIKALNTKNLSPDLKLRLQNALKKAVLKWTELQNRLKAILRSQIRPGSPAPDTPALKDPIPNPTSLEVSQALDLGDQGRYQEACNLLKAITPDSGDYALAQKKNREFSDRGVQEHRQKAAKFFQTSLSVPDPQSKKSYLLNAKRHLDEAKKNFPDADQTVLKANLQLIERHLARLGGGGS
jgi:hypothetical protein